MAHTEKWYGTGTNENGQLVNLLNGGSMTIDGGLPSDNPNKAGTLHFSGKQSLTATYIKNYSIALKFKAKKESTVAAVNGAVEVYNYGNIHDATWSEKIKLDLNNNSGNTYYKSSNFVPKVFNNGGKQANLAIYLYRSTIKSTIWDMHLEVKYTYKSYKITTESSEKGSVSGGGSYEYGTSVTVTAIPKPGYRFSRWSDGNTNPSRTIKVTKNITAYFVPVIYVTYDSIFSFKLWKDSGTGITVDTNAKISNISDIGFSIKNENSNSEGYTANSPTFPVVAGTTYHIAYDVSGDVGCNEVFVFYHNSAAGGSWTSFDHAASTNGFDFTPSTNCWISIRCDCNTPATSGVTYSNFRIYPANRPYMANTLSAVDRTDIDTWSVPTPTRQGYEFIGWNTDPNGNGTYYTANSIYPDHSLVLYSIWKANMYVGNKRSEIYVGNKKCSVYVGNKKVL